MKIKIKVKEGNENDDKEKDKKISETKKNVITIEISEIYLELNVKDFGMSIITTKYKERNIKCSKKIYKEYNRYHRYVTKRAF